MNYFFKFAYAGKLYEEEIHPQHAREVQSGQTVILSTYFPDIFHARTFYTVGDITHEKGKKIIELRQDYATNKKNYHAGLSGKDNNEG